MKSAIMGLYDELYVVARIVVPRTAALTALRIAVRCAVERDALPVPLGMDMMGPATGCQGTGFLAAWTSVQEFSQGPLGDTHHKKNIGPHHATASCSPDPSTIHFVKQTHAPSVPVAPAIHGPGAVYVEIVYRAGAREHLHDLTTVIGPARTKWNQQ